MSNIGNVAIACPDKIICEVESHGSGTAIWISSNNYTWKSKIEAPFKVKAEKEKISLAVPDLYNSMNSFNKQHSWPIRSNWSMIVVNIQKMIKSSFVGFKKYIKVNGVGYKIMLNEENKEELVVQAGLTHFLRQRFHPSLKINFTRKSRMARIRGTSFSVLTNMCSSLRNKRKPNVFTGKGIRFRKEKVWRKTGKKKKT